MTEEDIIDILENVFIFKNTSDKFTDLDLNAIKGLLDLYNKQKEKITSLENQLDFIGEQNKNINKLEKEYHKQKEIEERIKNKFISKDKIRDKILELTGIKGELEEKDFGIGFTLEDCYKEITIKIKAYKELLEEQL